MPRPSPAQLSAMRGGILGTVADILMRCRAHDTHNAFRGHDMLREVDRESGGLLTALHGLDFDPPNAMVTASLPVKPLPLLPHHNLASMASPRSPPRSPADRRSKVDTGNGKASHRKRGSSSSRRSAGSPHASSSTPSSARNKNHTRSLEWERVGGGGGATSPWALESNSSVGANFDRSHYMRALRDAKAHGHTERWGGAGCGCSVGRVVDVLFMSHQHTQETVNANRN